jgi:hypothetical protein
MLVASVPTALPGNVQMDNNEFLFYQNYYFGVVYDHFIYTRLSMIR